MLIPIGDEDKLIRTPFVNYALVAANVVLFFALAFRPDYYKEIVYKYGTIPAQFSPVTLVTSAFLHGGILHLLGNMWFLWIFGDNIEDRLGHLAYLGFYLGGAACADIIFVIANAGSPYPAIGASGAVAAVLGAYALMLPKVKIRFFYFFYYHAGTFAISAVFAIGYWAALQVISYVRFEVAGTPGIAYSAHLGGFGFGLAAGAITRSILSSIRKEQMETIDNWRRERKNASREPLVPYRSKYTEDANRELREYEKQRPHRPTPRRESRPVTHDYISNARERVSQLLAAGKEEQALEEYLSLIRRHKYTALPVLEQLRIADLFLTRQEHRCAQEAYERFLHHYPRHRHANDARYNLAMLCAEYTQDYATARRLLKELIRTEGDSAKLARLEEELKRVEDHFAKTYVEPAAGGACGTDAAEKFALFRQSGGQINVAEVGRVIAAMLKLQLADVTTRLFTSSGFLADSLSKSQADVLARDLQNMGVPVFLLEQERVRQLPEAILVDDAAFGPEGFSALIEGQEERVAWECILMANAGLLESSRTKEVKPPPDAIPSRRGAFGFGPRRKKTRLVKETQRRIVIDVLVLEPWRRLRIREGYTRFELNAERKQPSVRANIEHLAQEIVRHSGDTFVGEAVTALARGDRLSSFTYENRRKYDLANFWLAQRALYDRPD